MSNTPPLAPGESEPGADPESLDAKNADAQDSLPNIVVDRSAISAPVAHAKRFASALKQLRILPVIVLLFATGGVVGLYFQPPGLQKIMQLLGLEPGAGTSNPIAVPVKRGDEPGKLKGTSDWHTTVVGLGRLLPLGDITVVAMPFGAGDARIATLHVKEGDRVEQGALLASLDNERSLRAAVQTAQATVASREAGLQQIRESVIASRAEASASLSRAEALVVSAKRDFGRYQALERKGYASEAAYDTRRTAYEQAVQDVKRAKATLSRYSFEDIEAQDDVRVAARNADAAKAELSRAEAELDRAYVRAPSAGTVLTVHVRSGEKPGAKGIVNLGDIDKMTAEIEIYQSLIGQVEVGAPVTISANALPRPLDGAVTRIGLEVNRQTLTDSDPAANTDARAVKVYVLLSPSSSEIARRFTNLQVTARITAGARK